jgi:hypothetical protein
MVQHVGAAIRRIPTPGSTCRAKKCQSILGLTNRVQWGRSINDKRARLFIAVVVIPGAREAAVSAGR